MSDGEAAGVSPAELRAAVALARMRGNGCGEGIEWSPAEWDRVWSRLTAHQQRVVFLFVFAGMNLTEIADELKQSRGAVSGAWHRALERLRDALA